MSRTMQRKLVNEIGRLRIILWCNFSPTLPRIYAGDANVDVLAGQHDRQEHTDNKQQVFDVVHCFPNRLGIVADKI